jgi:hypothetical protein
MPIKFQGMKKYFIKIRKDALAMTEVINVRDLKDLTEEDLDILAEAINILNDAYESLYDEVFVELE